MPKTASPPSFTCARHLLDSCPLRGGRGIHAQDWASSSPRPCQSLPPPYRHQDGHARAHSPLLLLWFSLLLTVHAMAMAAMAKLAASVILYLMRFFRSTKCATTAASSCLTPRAYSPEPSLPLEPQPRTPPWPTSRGHVGHRGQTALGHRATNWS
jgi:hypothetical protein